MVILLLGRPSEAKEEMMAAAFTGVVVDCNDPHGLARFWGEVLGYEAPSGDGEFAGLDVPEGEVAIAFQRVTEPKVSKNRLHLDLTPSASQDDELERLLTAGAQRVSVGEPANATWVVLADPEGNEFCLLAGKG